MREGERRKYVTWARPCLVLHEGITGKRWLNNAAAAAAGAHVPLTRYGFTWTSSSSSGIGQY